MGSKIHRNSLKPGHKIHWYEIKDILGQGGFGITYLAYDSNLDKNVAIKEYLPIELAVREGDYSVHPVSEERGERYKWGLDRFIKEARTLAQFDHPNIVRVLSVTEGNNTAYMVMAYEHGQTLQKKLDGKKTLEESELLKIVIPILGGLEQIHEAGFIHRDIKPDNIFIRNDGSPVLLDFGSARQALGQQIKTLTSLVTPGYAPFEQYYSKTEQQGPWSDIYGLGATLYRSISGRPPADAIDRSNSLLRSSTDPYIPAIEIGKNNYSERFLKAIDHALQFKEENRPRSVTEWRGEFDIPAEYLHSKQHNILPVFQKNKIVIASTTIIVIIILLSSIIIYNSHLPTNINKENNVQKIYKIENKLDGIWSTSYGPLIFQVLSDGSFTGNYSFTPWENGKIYGNLNDHNFSGYFTEDAIDDESTDKCNKEYRGSFYWGTLEFEFNDEFTEFKGHWGDCADAREYIWKGKKN